MKPKSISPPAALETLRTQRYFSLKESGDPVCVLRVSVVKKTYPFAGKSDIVAMKQIYGHSRTVELGHFSETEVNELVKHFT
jgi:hypothetical protein